MNTNHQRESAKIYEFPRVRTIGGRRSADTRLAANLDLELPYASYADFGSWYHEEAVQQDAKPVKS
ncbi:DUF2735 domain-containing protein [Kaistia dalseonensis]|uniref:DUF2735 domain-containing protein n=1 Tax=Kaistia dalseonensis TaxID=410840 RepID=A0ABU0HCQ9_9HYPH|nr:DUF2735 domain-containing protein [Kaistia dalseonensis]MCX5497467.1 DUF2735 domain-containing protein [Kaistia dalseonensis]MDQ0440106.1 hypothetical protein [Kaistia dalseonensis]